MRRGPGLGGRLQFIRRKPVLAAIGVSALSIALVGGFVASRAGLLRAGAVAAKTTPTPLLRLSPGFTPPSGNPASGPDGNPASPSYPPCCNQASGPLPPSGNASSPSGPYPPFYPPASNGSVVPTLSLDCRLPEYAGPPGSGGFIVFPGGTFIADPTSSVTLPLNPGASAQPIGPGYGPGYPGLSYDHQYSRWVPVPTNWVSPDGSHYAYAASDGLYAVSVGSGSQTELRAGHSWSIVGVQNDGVDAGDQSAGGLWKFPFSGAPRQIATTGYWQAANSTAAYGTATSAVPSGVTNSILRLDLSTGDIKEWFTRPNTQSRVGGFDRNGNPIIYVQYLNNSGNEIWIASGATSAEPIAGFAGGTGFTSYGTPVADSHGVWFAGNWINYGFSATGVALYVAGSGFYWMSSIGGQLAGGCY